MLTFLSSCTALLSDIDNAQSYTYKVTYMYSENVVWTSDSVVYPAKTVDSLPENPSKTNCTFKGWFTSINNEKQFSESTAVVSDITVFAQWSDASSVITNGTEEGSSVPFVSTTDSTTLNTADILGITATTVSSSAASVATASIADGKIAITSVAKGSATVTCEDASAHRATIAVAVSETGAITLGAITKYTTSNANYSVQYYQMDTSGSYSKTAYETSNETGVVGANATYTSKTYEGFSFNSLMTGSAPTIASDGSTVYKIYYARNTITITLDANGGSNSDGNTISGLYGASVTSPTDPTYSGHTFNSWSPAVPSTFPVKNLTCKAQWKNVFIASTDSTTANTVDVLGITAATVTSSAATVATAAIADGKIAITSGAKGTATVTCEDASAHRATIAVTVSETGAITLGAITKYTSTSANYTVQYYKMETSGSYSETAAETSQQTGTAGASATYTAKTYEGFALDSTKTGIAPTIAEDNSTVYKIYYARNTITITLVANGGTLAGGVSTISGLYGASVTSPTVPTYSGHTFSSWSPVIPSTFPVANLTCTAQWKSASTSTKKCLKLSYSRTPVASSGVNELKGYITYISTSTSKVLSSISGKIYIPEDSYNKGFTGSKVYWKTGSSWTWAEGTWTNAASNTWTSLTGTSSSSDVLKECGMQIYSKTQTSAVSGLSFYFDDISISFTDGTSESYSFDSLTSVPSTLTFANDKESSWTGTLSLVNEDDFASSSGGGESSSLPTKAQVMSYLNSIYKSKVLTGQMQNSWSTSIDMESRVYNLTGKYPAIMGFDFMNFSTNDGRGDMVSYAKSWAEKGGLVTYCWHWRDPSNKSGEFYSSKTSFRIPYSNGSLETSSTNFSYIKADLDSIAAKLQTLEDAGIVVLWRPLHEAGGDPQYNDPWFWWGESGSEAYIALYKYMYDYFTNTKGLANLIWVWNGQGSSWYPGDAYVDIAGFDKYSSDHSSLKTTWESTGTWSGNSKPVALSENGCIPSPDNIKNDGAWWLYFMTWNDDDNGNNYLSASTYNSGVVSSYYASDLFITLDELPTSWSSYN
ncbi:MAG: glycosyl hydrolase [Treponema sp.]